MRPRIIAVTLGDPNGIGPEIAIASALRPPEGGRVVLVGDRGVADHYAGDASIRLIDPAAMPAARPGTIDLVVVDSLADGELRPGACSAASGRATIDYARRAVVMAQAGQVDAVVGCPHNEAAIHAAGIRFSGYPALVAELTGAREDQVFLMLVGGDLRIVHATLHERLADALRRLDTALVVRATIAARDALVALGVASPRIGLFGINPHAGEDGLFGDDDDRVTVPAVSELRAQGINAVGPQGADLMLGDRDCDAFVAMYHDQGHIPVKLVAGRSSAAFTIGSDILFSSVGHGSAPDIAGRGLADAQPLLRTLALLIGASAVATGGRT